MSDILKPFERYREERHVILTGQPAEAYYHIPESILVRLITSYASTLAQEAERKGLQDLRGWIDRVHYQPVNESDRWVQASGEIIMEIDNRLASLTPQDTEERG